MGYDPVGNLKTLDDGGTDTLGTVTYAYDAANRMTALVEPGTGATTTYGYDDANRRTSITYPGNLGMQIGYDPAGHQTASTGGILNGTGGFQTVYSSFSYNYKLPSGQYSNLLQSVTRLDPLTWNTTKSYYTHNYTYDTMSRVTVDEVKDHNNVEVEELSYGYDKAGNRTSFSQFSTGESISYSYPSANELGTKGVNGTTTTSYTYDGNGNLTGATPGNALSYNKKNQTTAIGSDSYTYSGATQADRVQVNSTTMNYSGLGISSQSDSGGTTYYLRCSCGLLNSERTPDGKTHYYLFDALDSVVGLLDSSSKNLDNAYTYDPFGQTHSEIEGEDNPWQYASGYFDGGTQLYHFGSRYYDPELGRWTQQDPVAGSLGDLGSVNRYAYANDDPVNLVDTSGKFSISTNFFGVNINPTSFDIGALSIYSGYLAVIGSILAVLLPDWSLIGIAIATLGAAATEISVYSGVSCGGGSVNVFLFYIDPFTPFLSCG